MILSCDLKLATKCGTSWEIFCCRLSSVTTCVLPEATWYKLQSDLQMIDARVGPEVPARG